MKKFLSALLFALVTTTVFVSNAFAAPAQAGKAVTLQRVTYERGGITLLFHTSGLSKNDLKNTSFNAHSKQWNMVCSFVNDNTDVRCLVSKKLSMFAGSGFQGKLAGFTFAGVLPSARAFPDPVVTAASTTVSTLMTTETTTACPNGQTLWYTFEYSNPSYQAEVWSDHYIDPDTFQSLYNVYPEYTTTYTDSYWLDGVYYTETFYIYGYTTYTGGHGATPADNWDTLVSAYEADGYNIQKTGESCNNGA